MLVYCFWEFPDKSKFLKLFTIHILFCHTINYFQYSVFFICQVFSDATKMT